MHICSAHISCGIGELVAVGDQGNYYCDKHGRFKCKLYKECLDKRFQLMETTYLDVMRKEKKGSYSAMIIASLTTAQKDAIRLLLKYGWDQIGAAKRNPNSGNRILLFVKRMGERKPKSNLVKSKSIKQTALPKKRKIKSAKAKRTSR